MQQLTYQPERKLNKNRYQELLRVRQDTPHIGPLRLANPDLDEEKMNQLCKALSNGEISPSEILLTTGLGLFAKNEDLPIRLPAILLPALQLMKNMQQQGLQFPKYLIYQATDFIAKMNGISPVQAQRVSQRMKKYIENFISDFYPELQTQVEIEFQLAYEKKTQQSIEKITNSIHQLIQEIPEIGEILKELNKGEEQNSKRNGQALQYAAANALYNGANSLEYPFQRNAKAIIPIGGNAEKPFFTLTSHISSSESKTPIIPLLSHLGSNPTYYSYQQKGEILTSERFEPEVIQTINPHLKHDIEALQRIGLTREKLQKIYPQL